MTVQEIEFITPYIEYTLKTRYNEDISSLTDEIDIKVCRLADTKIDISDTDAIEKIKAEINELSNIYKFGLLIRMLFRNTNGHQVCSEPYRTIIKSLLLDEKKYPDMRYIFNLYRKALSTYEKYYTLIMNAYYEKIKLAA